MKKRISYYWLCQIIGWSAYIVLFIFFYLTLRTRIQPSFYQMLVSEASLGFIITHIMRAFIQKYKLVDKPVNEQVIYIILISIIFTLIYGTTTAKLEEWLEFESEKQRQLTFVNKMIRISLGYFFIIIVWNLIYFAYHYIVKTRQAQLDKIRLESLVKELELKTIKAHINPHFIFNALNSIRALIDENPNRARNAITELSNILRSSMQAEKVETVPFEKELGIVKDYLALEYIRFEDRLKIEYQIDEDTLDQPVPPMMLQTLVENAIKHGIGKQIGGGLVRVISDFKENFHELVVLNTGYLNGHVQDGDGFGLFSTKNRLQLLFGEKANFEIKQVGSDLVEARILIPVEIK
ncbi:histidine kinase [Niastella populi]|jgi:two-component system LytT family sensor kinase|uniref:Histidine kinase n=2 Tax=Niastella populi TaxID=550983 RepID=A0A1V9FJX3_9BACT|nr:histidine kinase [Niastella populi]